MVKTYPFYFKSTVILLGLVLFVFSLFTLRSVLVPLSFALMLAILLNPLTSLFQKWRLPRILSIVLSILIAIILITGIIYFIFSQIGSFSSQLPEFKKKFLEMFSRLQHSLYHSMGIKVEKQNQVLNEAETNMKPVIANALGSMAGSLAVTILVPVYTFLFLYYKTLLLNFLYELLSRENSTEVAVVLGQAKKAIQSYMFGLAIEGLIVAVLNSIALLLLGVDYAILLGVLGAVINVLPFIGGILAVLFPLLISIVTGQGLTIQLGIIISYIIIQFIDNHFLIPYIVSSKVKINALISIIIVLMGGLVWGIAGMFLSIPVIGILKIIFDHIPELKPWAKLLGNEVPTRHKGVIWNAGKKKEIEAKTEK